MSHLTHEMHANSLAAYHEGTETRETRSSRILSLFDFRAVLTDREVCERLEYPDMNAVRPRITELIKQGLLREVGHAIDRVTGRKVRLVALTEGQMEMWK